MTFHRLLADLDLVPGNTYSAGKAGQRQLTGTQRHVLVDCGAVGDGHNRPRLAASLKEPAEFVLNYLDRFHLVIDRADSPFTRRLR